MMTGTRRAAGAQLAQHLEAVHRRQSDIQQHEVDVAARARARAPRRRRRRRRSRSPADSSPRLTNAAMRGSSSTIRILRHPAASRCSTTSPARTGAGSSARRQRQVDREGRAAAGGVGDGAMAAVALGDRVDDREAQSRAADRALAVRAVEAAEDAVARRGRDAGPVVAHPQSRARGVRARCRSRSACRRACTSRRCRRAGATPAAGDPGRRGCAPSA